MSGLLTCGVCGIVFHGRCDAIYCSSACRQKAHRARTARRNAEQRRPTARTPRALIGPDVARTIQRARDEQSRAHELCRTAADTLRETGASYRRLTTVHWLTLRETGAPRPRPSHGLSSLICGGHE